MMRRSSCLSPPQYDHFQFPGVVPRTFIGPLLLAGATAPSTLLVQWLGLPKSSVQVLVRLCLATFVWLGFHRFAKAVAVTFGPVCAHLLIAIVSVQFHFLFYTSRTLPNTFAIAAGVCAA